MRLKKNEKVWETQMKCHDEFGIEEITLYIRQHENIFFHKYKRIYLYVSLQIQYKWERIRLYIYVCIEEYFVTSCHWRKSMLKRSTIDNDMNTGIACHYFYVLEIETPHIAHLLIRFTLLLPYVRACMCICACYNRERNAFPFLH